MTKQFYRWLDRWLDSFTDDYTRPVGRQKGQIQKEIQVDSERRDEQTKRRTWIPADGENDDVEQRQTDRHVVDTDRTDTDDADQTGR